MGTLRDIFLENIKERAEALKLDYKDIADRSGLSRSGIYKIMQGQREPGFDNIERIAKALGIEPYRLLLSVGQVAEPTPREALKILAEAINAPAKPSFPVVIPGIPEDELLALFDDIRARPDAFGAVRAAARGLRAGNKANKGSA